MTDSSGPIPVINSDGSIEFLVDGVPHRVGKPALIHADGKMDWLVEGEYHRLGGPARETVVTRFYLCGVALLDASEYKLVLYEIGGTEAAALPYCYLKKLVEQSAERNFY